MTKIRILDNLTIQKIAAGEVIERPASIVKELVENSIDANANNIVIEISEGGKSFIRISDDGDGIDEDDLKLAFERHSTSKLRTIEDIYNIMSLGFRGEALSSISSVSKVEVLSKTNSTQAGIQAQVEEGIIQSMDSVGCPKGTTMIIRDLFYNLPVRKNFMKTDKTEGNYISDIVYKLALGNYNKGFKFIRDNKVILQTNSNSDLKDNIYGILGKEFSDNLININFENNGIKIFGFISNNKFYRSNRSHQYIYINGRYIVNYGISSVIENQYKSLIPLSRFPVFILYIEMNPGDIDVNIHPTKQEIKFINNTNIHGIISNIVKESLNNSLYVPKMDFKEDVIKDESEGLTELFKEEETNIYSDIVIKDYTSLDKEFTIKKDNSPALSQKVYDNYSFVEEKLEKIEKDEDIKVEYLKDDIYEEQKIEEVLSNISPIGVAFGTYIIAENRESGTLYFVDQHAAHERVMYERYLNEFENEIINTQQLIAPEIIELTNREMDEVVSNIDFFRNMGFDIEEFGPSSMALRGVPLIFGKPNARSLFLEILDNLKNDLKSSYDVKVEKIMKLACSSAIKANDKMSNIEILELFKDLKSCENSHTCPHGRPILIEITKRDIEKQFLRIG